MSGHGHFFVGGHEHQRFAGGRYHYLAGGHYHRWGRGERFPHAYWRSDYYIYDWADYGVPPPPDDYQWVRYGPDLVLFDLDTGEIAQVVPGVFDEDTAPPDDGQDQGQGDGDGQGPPPDDQQ